MREGMPHASRREPSGRNFDGRLQYHGSEQDPQSRSSSRGWERTLVLIVAAVCVLAVVGAGAFAFGRSSAKRAAASGSPVDTVRVVVPVTACPSTYGVEGQRPSAIVYSPIALTLPSSVAHRLAFYSDQARSIDPILGPKGWDCSVTVGADGSFGITVRPPGQRRLSTFGSGPAPADSEAITLESYGPCSGCVALAASPFFVNARTYYTSIGMSLPTVPPAHEQYSFVRGTASSDAGTVYFVDPPHVKGTGEISGGNYPAVGAMQYNGSISAVGVLTCVLPPSHSALCSESGAPSLHEGGAMGIHLHLRLHNRLLPPLRRHLQRLRLRQCRLLAMLVQGRTYPTVPGMDYRSR